MLVRSLTSSALGSAQTPLASTAATTLQTPLASATTTTLKASLATATTTTLKTSLATAAATTLKTPFASTTAMTLETSVLQIVGELLGSIYIDIFYHILVVVVDVFASLIDDDVVCGVWNGFDQGMSFENITD